MALFPSTAWREPKGAARAAVLEPPIIWEGAGRSAGSSALGPRGDGGACRCLWSSGPIANRASLCERLGAPSELTDGELLARLFSRFGPRAAELVEGAAAWIVHDEGAGRLIAGRDRLGLRGLYFVTAGDKVVLSDRVAPLLEHVAAPPRFRTLALVAQIHGLAPPPGVTFYRGVDAVRPGEMLLLERGVERRVYWRLSAPPRLRLRGDEEYGEALRERLLETVRGYLPAARAGVTLSGGLDSTAVAWTLRRLRPESDVEAVSWVSPELPEADESAAIGEVVERLRLTPAPVRADRHWSLSDPEGFATSPDGPFRNYYEELWRATFEVARGRGLRWLFTGASGDHLFGGAGAQPLVDLLLAGEWTQLARRLREQAASSDGGLVGLAWAKLARPLAAAVAPAALRRSPRPASWLAPRHLERFRRLAAGRPRSGWTPGRRGLLRTLRDPLLAAIVERLDRQAAAAGIELLHPLLDRRLCEFAASLPADQLARGGRRKIVVRSAMRGRLPDSVVERRGKTYPSAVLGRGLLERERGKAEALMRDMRAAELGLIDEAELRRAWERYRAGQGDSLFWHTLALEDWLRRYS